MVIQFVVSMVALLAISMMMHMGIITRAWATAEESV
jgi:hypothetical protein